MSHANPLGMDRLYFVSFNPSSPAEQAHLSEVVNGHEQWYGVAYSEDEFAGVFTPSRGEANELTQPEVDCLVDIAKIEAARQGLSLPGAHFLASLTSDDARRFLLHTDDMNE